MITLNFPYPRSQIARAWVENVGWQTSKNVRW